MTSKKIKVAVVVPTHWEYLMGGAQLQAKMLLEELVRRGNVEVNYFASRVSATPIESRDYTLTQVRAPNFLHRYGLFWDYFSLQRELEHYQPDLVYQRVATAYTGISARYAKRNGIPMIWHVANSTDCDVNRFDLASLRRPHAYLERAFVAYGRQNASHIIAQNQDQKTLLDTNFRELRSTIIPNFHPIPERFEKPPPTPLRVLWIANLKDSKRPEAMVEVARRLVHSTGIHFEMIGAPYPSPEQKKQDSIEKSIAVLPNLNYLGPLPLEEVNMLLARSHLLVNTSLKEGFSNTFIQAWLRCVPVLTLGVNPDNRLDGGPLGQSFSSINEMIAGLNRRQEHVDSLRKNGEGARALAKQQFSLDNVKRLADLLLSLCKNSDI